MATIATLPLATYQVGTTTIPEFAISDALTVMSASCQRNTTADLTIWPLSTTSISVTLDFWDGAQWVVGVFRWSDTGGLRQSHGADVPRSYAIWPLPEGVGRKLRGSVTISGGAVRTSATVDGT